MLENEGEMGRRRLVWEGSVERVMKRQSGGELVRGVEGRKDAPCNDFEKLSSDRFQPCRPR
jgi:hypothetical protein